ncbi:helix-turn-helix domain-containing protein [Streptomyces sp. NPDC020731]|uniref:helix-turn-helix domain-containing protein n=1 Tax=Streptomyces sp. NPDC020731 TaxID=3365085 RepID=UPI0037B4FA93
MPRTPVDGTRLRILTLLREQDTSADGLTAEAVAARLALPRPVALTHLRLLTALGLLRTGRSGGRVRYRRDEIRIAEVAQLFEKGWQRPRPRRDPPRSGTLR